MALRTRTIEFAYPHSTTSVAAAGVRNFTSINLYIPNTTGVTFQSVILEVSISDNAGAGSSAASILLGIGLGAVAVDTATVTQVLANSGETQSWTFTRDVTSYFTTNWTGTTMTSTARITVATSITINASAKLIITYQFEDTDVTNRIKTVKIPIDGNTGIITSTASNFGAANQVPNLSTFLPESSKVFRDIFFECYGHYGVNSTNTGNAIGITLNYTLGGVATDRVGGDFSNATQTDFYFKRIDKIETLTTNATSSITVRTTNGNTGDASFPCLSGVLVVTYEYDHAASTSIMNSLQIPVVMENSVMGGTTDANRSLYRTQFFIQEPATITLAQSGILMTLLDGSQPFSMIVNCGSQTDRTFNQHPSITTHQVSGSRYISRRIDSGAQGGAGITIARGLNTFDVEFYNTSTTSGAIGLGNSVMLYLNYTSGKDSNGDGVHAHTVVHATRPYTVSSSTQRASVTVSRLVSIPETSYYLVSTGYEYIDISIGTTVQNCQFTHNVQYSATEGPGVGWKDIATLVYHNLDTEAGTTRSWVNTNDIFRKYPDANYPNTYQLDIEASRSHQLTISNLNQLIQILQYVTYHSITYTISGTISGSNGGAVSIEAYRADTGEKISSTSRTGNGSYSMTWYDNTINVFVVAYESSTYKGMSAEQVAGNTFNISLSSGGAGGPTYYSYV